MLWENPNPSSPMNQATLTTSESITNFEKYEILYTPFATASNRICSSGLIPTSKDTILFSNGSEGYCRRIINVNGNNQINVQVGVIGSTSEINTACIPYQIYGYFRKS